MNKQNQKPRPRRFPRPREYCAAVERRMKNIRPLLLKYDAQRKSQDVSGSMDDAIRIAALIERFALLARRADAETAVDLAGRIELLLELLQVELDAN